MATTETIAATVRSFLIENLYNGQETAELTNDTPLITSRLMDSIVALKLVNYLEENFSIEFEAHEVDQDNLNTIAIISAFVQSKMK